MCSAKRYQCANECRRWASVFATDKSCEICVHSVLFMVTECTGHAFSKKRSNLPFIKAFTTQPTTSEGMMT